VTAADCGHEDFTRDCACCVAHIRELCEGYPVHGIMAAAMTDDQLQSYYRFVDPDEAGASSSNDHTST
jgi:hypothetical protein